MRAKVALASGTKASARASERTKISGGSLPDVAPAHPSRKPASAHAAETYGKLPLSFEANQGQTDARVKFISRGVGYALFLTPTEAVFALQQAAPQPEPQQQSAGQQADVLRMQFVGSNPVAQLVGAEAAPGRVNYLVGNDTTRWRTAVPTYAQVIYRELYPGIDLIYYGNQQQLEYDFRLAPGSRPETIKLRFAGARRLSLDRQGNLLLHLQDGTVRQPKPLVYQEIGGARRVIEGAYVLQGHNRVGIKVGVYDVTRPLVIDPVLIYSTYLGGTGTERGQAIALDAAGSAYVTGYTSSQDFPVVNPFQSTHNNTFGRDAFIAKLNATGTALVYATYLGGSADDLAYGIALDQTGAAYVTGYTYSNNFPTVNPLQATLKGLVNAFVVKLNATGTALDYATYLGGSGYDVGIGIAVDAAGNAYVAGSTSSQDFPVVNPLQATRHGSLLFQSADSGDNWAGSDNGLQGFEVYATKIDPTNPANVYAATGAGVYKSLDGGDSWRISHPVAAQFLALAPSNPAVLYAADLFSPFYKSTDGGNNWTMLTAPDADAYMTSLVVDPTNAAIVYVSSDQGLFKSTNGGSSWTQINLNQYDYDVLGIVINPANPAILYAFTTPSSYFTQPLIYKSTNGGSSWTPGRTGLPQDTPINLLALAPSSPDTLYAVLQSGIYKTIDGGLHWTPTGSSPPSSYNFNALAVAPTDANVVYAAGYLTNGVYKSTDGGNTWPLGSNGFTSRTVQSLEVAPTNPARVYAGVWGGDDVFVAKLNPAGSALVYATYIGGAEDDGAFALAINAAGSAYVAGFTQSINFPTVNPAQATNHGSDDGFVIKLNPAGSALDFATYLGGSYDEFIYGLALDPAENVYLAGSTTSADLPTVNPIQTANLYDKSAFVTRLDSAGSTIMYSTYLGGTSEDYARGIVVNANGEASVVGTTSSTDFPTVAPAQASRNGFQDAFVTQLNAGGTALKFSTYLGGGGSEIVYAVAADANDNLYVTGSTTSNNLPTVNPLQPTYRGGGDAFIVKLGATTDLSVTMTGSRDPVIVNGSLTYTLTATNRGPSPATSVVLTDALPAAVLPGAVTTTQGACNTTNTNVTCNLGDLPPQAAVVVSITVTPTSAGQISNTASIQGHEPDSVAANNTATLVTTVTVLPSVFGHIVDANGLALSAATITLDGAQSATTQSDGNGLYRFANLSPGNTYTVTPRKAGYTFTPLARTFANVQQDVTADFRADTCAYSLAPAAQSFGESGGTGRVNVTATGDCPWNVSSNVSWLTITSGQTGAGDGVVEFSVAPTTAARSGRLTIAGQPFPVWQEFQSCAVPAFKAAHSYPVGLYPQSLVTADFNNDGRPDLATVQSDLGQNSAVVLLNNGRGGFAAPVYYPGDGSRALTTGDINNDGKLDLVLTDYTQLEILYGAGDGTFGAPSHFTVGRNSNYSTAVTDFNRDGNADLAVAYENATDFHTITSILFGNGTGSFGPPQLAFTGGVAAVADFNNDSNPDLITLNGSNTFTLRLGDGTGQFAAPINTSMGRSFGQLIAKDLNGDGRQDLVAPGAVFLGNGDGSFSPPASLALDPQRSHQLAIGDFNNDAQPDLLVSDYVTTTVYLGDGTGRYDPARAVNISLVLGSVANDFDGDGRTDLAGANSGTHTVNIWLNDCQAEPGVSISGQVTDQRTGFGLGSYVLVYLSSARLGQLVAQTDSNGRYVFRDLARDDDYTLTIYAPPYSFPTKTVNHPATDQVVDFSGTAPTHKVSGRVTEGNSSGPAVPGVQLLLTTGPGTLTTTQSSDANGNYVFADLPLGVGSSLNVRATNVFIFNPPLYAIPNTSTDFIINVVAGRRSYGLSGHVKLATGAPLGGALVTLSGGQNRSTQTDSNGDYSFSGVPAGFNYTLNIAAANYAFSPANRSFYFDSELTGMDFATLPNPGTIIISEFRFRGPTDDAVQGLGGDSDEYIELYNNTDQPFTVATNDGSPGWALVALTGNGAAMTTLVVLPNGLNLPPRTHYLVVNQPAGDLTALGDKQQSGKLHAVPRPPLSSNPPSAQYSLDAYASSDAAYTDVDIPDDAGVALFRTANPTNFNVANRLDAAGYNALNGAPADLFREGTALQSPGANDGQYTFMRKLSSGVPQDTNDNAQDFVFVSTDGGSYGGVPSTLGAPGPENTQSPIQRNAQFKAALIDTGASSTAAPNRVRDTTANVCGGPNCALGTLTIRRKFTNKTGGFVTRLRFRLVDITTAPAPAGTADLRALDAADASVVTSGGGSITVKGMLLDQPPAQPLGGGLNSTLTVALGGALAPNASINVQFVLGVQQGGGFRFIVNVEGFTGTAASSAPDGKIMGRKAAEIAPEPAAR